MAPAPLSHYDFLLGHPIKHEKVISARPFLPLPLHSIYIHIHRVPRPVLLRPPVCGTCGAGREGGRPRWSGSCGASVRSYIWRVCSPAFGLYYARRRTREEGGRGGTGQGRRFAQLFPLHSLSLPSQHNRQEMEKEEGARRGGRREALQFFLDFSCHFHDPPASERAGSRAAGRSAALSLVVSASGASSIHLERGKVDAIGDAATKEYRGLSNRLPFTAISCYTGSLLRNVIWSSV